MAKGFKPTENKSSSGYNTLFERTKEKTNGEEQSWQWYRKTLRSMALEYKQQPDKTIRDEKRDRSDSEDNQDKNRLRRYARQGRLFLFEYKAVSKYLPYYDRFPLVYVFKANADHFIGANLHYLHPKRRPLVINKLKDERIDIPRICIHKYILDHVDGFLLDLALDEWDTAIAIPLEQFVKTKGNILVPYKPADVWKETEKTWGDRIKAKRIIKGYGKPEDIEEVR